jgi:hypothetical protein
MSGFSKHEQSSAIRLGRVMDGELNRRCRAGRRNADDRA